MHVKLETKVNGIVVRQQWRTVKDMEKTKGHKTRAWDTLTMFEATVCGRS